ncbi:fatty acyl-CoA reductase 3-like [Prunus avium]|uniref:Fatty acyl-CoA reductase n=1 Tax=Prunus avium TaxID=42229 RepID=A0A6P5T4A4_PRUAV|nr:fatty acyl-CoA reductase 3-like [Prunus avium]
MVKNCQTRFFLDSYGSGGHTLQKNGELAPLSFEPKPQFEIFTTLNFTYEQVLVNKAPMIPKPPIRGPTNKPVADTGVLINIASSNNVMFAEAFNTLQVDYHLINWHITLLINFSGDVVQPIDNINLPITIGTSSICLSPSLTILSLTIVKLLVYFSLGLFTNIFTEFSHYYFLYSFRAKLYGWPNTYVFTKAMGEILLRHSKDNLSIVIIRPTVITSTYKEPFPGWVQGFRTIDSVIAGYCKGKLTCLLVDPMSVFDMVPVDMVVNSITVAMVANANKPSSIIYHVGSSLRNPINFLNIHSFVFRYFTKNPWIDKDGKPVKVGKLKFFKTMATFRMYMQIRFMLPLEGLKFMNKAFGGYFQDLYVNYNQKLKLVMCLVELYEPYMLFKGIFDDNNAEELRRITRERFVDAEAFNFDARCIDWEDYIMHTHIPGLQKHVMMKR